MAKATVQLSSFANVTVQQEDAEALPFESESFDVAFLFHTLAYATSPQALLNEVARVLAPGGRLILLGVDRHDHQKSPSVTGTPRLFPGKPPKIHEKIRSHRPSK